MPLAAINSTKSGADPIELALKFELLRIHVGNYTNGQGEFDVT
jgi:hypothetical protein